MNNILVTGGSGFIGSNLCKELLEDKKNFVYCVDNLYSGNIDNIKEIIPNKNFQFINHDINIPLDLKVEQIYNLACPASPNFYQFDPVQTIKTNVIGTMNLLELAKKNNAKFFLASTSEVYGDPLIHPQKESYWGNVNPIGIRSCYDEGKRCAETLCMDFYRQYKMEIKIVRIFNTYGPYLNLDDGRVVSNFIVQSLTNKNITLYGDGKQTRSFCFISDMINGFIKMMNSNKNITGPINLGNPEEMNMIDLAKNIISLTKSKSKLAFKDLPLDDPKRRKPDIEKAKKILKWKPKISLEEGLFKTINYFQKRL
jgi:UDP-glucuronate decarboxylase